MNPPQIEVHKDWEEFTLPYDIGSGRSMFVNTGAGPTLRMKFFRRTTDDHLVGRVWFNAATFGPPGHVHGGVIAYVIDEAMGSCSWLNLYPSVAAHLELNYRAMSPIGEDLFIEAQVLEVTPSKLNLKCELSFDNQTLVEATGVFVRLSKDKMLEMSKKEGMDIPDLDRFHFGV